MKQRNPITWRANKQGSCHITTEWKTYCQLLVNKPENDLQLQLKELVSNDMVKTLFPNLSKIATICLSISVATASVERNQMKLIKTHSRSSLKPLSPDVLTDFDLEEVVNVWNRKGRR